MAILASRTLAATFTAMAHHDFASKRAGDSGYRPRYVRTESGVA